MKLRQTNEGQTVTIISIPEQFKKRLIGLGILPNAEIKVLINKRKQPFVLEIGGSKVMIARFIAREIECK